jgi:hypothetical protein
MRRSTVLSLPLQLVFPGHGNKKLNGKVHSISFISLMNNFSFSPVTNFELLFKIFIFVFLNSNLISKLLFVWVCLSIT